MPDLSGIDGTLVIDPISGVPAQLALEATMQQILTTLRAQVDLGQLFVTDTTNGKFYVRRESVNEGTGVITVSFVNLDGSVAAPAPTVTNLTPVTGGAGGGGTGITVVPVYFDVITAGTGYAVGDVLARVLFVNTGTNAISAAVWYNVSQGSAISAPTAAHVTEADQNTKVTGTVSLAAGAAAIGSVNVASLPGSPSQDGTDPATPTVANAGTGIRGWLATMAGQLGGNLKAVLQAGTAIVGRFGIDQTTQGNTNGVALVGPNVTAPGTPGSAAQAVQGVANGIPQPTVAGDVIPTGNPFTLASGAAANAVVAQWDVSGAGSIDIYVTAYGNSPLLLQQQASDGSGNWQAVPVTLTTNLSTPLQRVFNNIYTVGAWRASAFGRTMRLVTAGATTAVTTLTIVNKAAAYAQPSVYVEAGNVAVTLPTVVASPSTAQVAIPTGTTTTQVLPTGRTDQFVLIKNTGTVRVYIGPAGITAATGYPLGVGEFVKLDAKVAQGVIHAVLDTAQTTAGQISVFRF